MIRLTGLLLSGILWAVMMFLLFEREIRPYFEYQQPPSYKVMLRNRSEPELVIRTLRFGRQDIGRAESIAEPQPSGGYLLRNRILLHMQPFVRWPIGDDRVTLSSDVRVDDTYQLSEFKMEGRFQGIPFSAGGARRQDKMVVWYQLLVRGERTIDLPRDAMLSDNFIPYQGGARLSEGKKWRMRMVDVEGMILSSGNAEKSVRDVYAAVVGREKLEHKEKIVEAFKVEVRKEANDEIPAYTLWVDDEGAVLQQLMMINKLPCTVTLAEKRTLTVPEARAYAWDFLK